MEQFISPFRGLPKGIYVLCLARMINAMGLFIFPLFTMILTRRIGVSSREAGFWIMMTGVVFLISNLAGGKLTDVFGRKKIIVICDILGGLTYVICGFMAPSIAQIWMILIACFFFGMSEPAHNAIIADITTPENRDQSFALSYISFNLGFAIGPAVGGVLFERYYAWIFWGDAITLLVAIILIGIWVRESFGSVYQEYSEDRVLERPVEGSIFKVLLERPILIVFATILLLYNFSYAQWHFLLPLQMNRYFDAEGPALFGLLASINGIVVLLSTPIITHITQNLSNLKKVAVGGIFYTVGFGLYGFVSKTTFVAYVAGCIIFTLGEVLVVTNFMPYIANRTPASHRGRMDAVVPLIMGVGYSVGPLAMGKGLDYFSIETGWMLISALMVLATFMMMGLNRWEGHFVQRATDTETSEEKGA